MSNYIVEMKGFLQDMGEPKNARLLPDRPEDKVALQNDSRWKRRYDPTFEDDFDFTNPKVTRRAIIQAGRHDAMMVEENNALRKRLMERHKDDAGEYSHRTGSFANKGYEGIAGDALNGAFE